jgi:hypothetical protein
VWNVLFRKLSSYSLLHWPWTSVDGVEACEGSEFPFFLQNIGVLCEGGCTRGLDSSTWSKTCLYFALSDDVVRRLEPRDSILTYPERLQASRRFRKSFKSSELLIFFSVFCFPSIITLIWCRTHFFSNYYSSSLLHMDNFEVCCTGLKLLMFQYILNDSDEAV